MLQGSQPAGVCVLLQVAPAQPPKLAADAEIGTKPEEADEEVSTSAGAKVCLLERTIAGVAAADLHGQGCC